MTKLDELLDQIGNDSRILFLANALMDECERQGYKTVSPTSETYHIVSIHYHEDTGTFEVRSGWGKDDWYVSGRRVRES